MVCCSRLKLAVPIGRSPFAAVPLDPFRRKAVMPIDLYPPFDLPLPPCPNLPSVLPFPFPCWVEVVALCWVEVLWAPCWHPCPGLVPTLDDVVCPLLGGVATRGEISLPCSVLIASTLGSIDAVTPCRERPPVGLRCHIRNLVEAPLDPP